MMSRGWMVGVAGVVFVLGSGCAATEGSGVQGSETRNVSAFDRLEIRVVNARVEVDPAAREGTIEVRGDDNLVRRVRTHVDDGKLVIDAGDGDVDPSLPLEVVLKTRSLKKIEAGGEAKVVAHGRIDHLDANLFGGARLEARDLVARSVDLTAAGDSFAAICAEDRLEVDLAGGADAEYYCDPRTVDEEVSGGAHLWRR